MPGFNIGGGKGPEANSERFRVHRWSVDKLGPAKGGVDIKHLVYAESLQLPSLSIESAEIKGYALSYKFAKSPKYEDVTVTFYADKELYEAVSKWHEKSFNIKDGLGYAADYKGPCEFTLQGKTSLKFTLKQSWLKSVKPTRLTYSSSDLFILSVIIAYDWYELESSPAGFVETAAPPQ